MNPRWRIALVVLLLAVMAGFGVWTFLSRDPLFHGKPESEWIKGIAYNGDEEQVRLWRSFGPEGLDLLTRALDRGRFYRKSYHRIMPKLPAIMSVRLSRVLPNPATGLASRMGIVSLLCRLGQDAKLVEPAIARALSEEDPPLRQLALACYEQLLDVMTEKEKDRRLPAFLRAMQDRNTGVRNNATVALRGFPHQAEVVGPVLIKALADPVVGTRLLAAKALVRVDLEAGVRAGMVKVVVEILKHPNAQVSHQAAQLLGEIGREPNLVVPALLQAVRRENSLVATFAARALGKFPSQAEVIVPVLLKALSQTNGPVARWAASGALKEIDPAAARQAGIE